MQLVVLICREIAYFTTIGAVFLKKYPIGGRWDILKISLSHYRYFQKCKVAALIYASS
jgi:hypothetical protein